MLRDRLLGVEETLQEVELAAGRRLDEALELMKAERPAGAIYLLGYVAEIHLKNAVYRRLGAGPNATTVVFRRRAFEVARALELSGHEKQFESGHGLLFWARLIWSVPNTQGHELPSGLRSGLCRHTLRLVTTWWFQMRYRSDPCTMVEARLVGASVEWIVRNRVQLWS